MHPVKSPRHRWPREPLEPLLKRYRDMAYHVAVGVLRNPAEAEDAVQEAFLSAYHAYPRFKGQSKFSTWLCRIVINACLMRLRRAKAHDRSVLTIDFLGNIAHARGRDPEAEAINSELREVLVQALDALPEPFRTAVVLRDVQGMSAAEAAEVLGVSVDTVKSRLHRGRLMLRKLLARYDTGQQGRGDGAGVASVGVSRTLPPRRMKLGAEGLS